MSGFTEIDIPETLHITEPETPVDPPSDDAPREKSPREQIMEVIAERRREAIEREQAYGVVMEDAARAAGGGEPIDRDVPPSDDGAGAPDLSKPEPMGAELQQPAPVSAPAPSSAERRHLIQVGGQQFNVSDAELTHLAQMGAVATVAMQQQGQQPPPQRAEHTPPPPVQPHAPDRAKMAETWRKMSFGSEEEGVAALSELVQSITPQQPQLDPHAIAHYASQHTRAQMTLESNLATLGREFADIFGPTDRAWTPDEVEIYETRAQAAALKLDKIRRRDALTGAQRSDLDVYREAATMIRASLGGSPQSGSQQTTTPASQAVLRPVAATSSDRLERKRAAPRQPTAVSRAAMSGETAQPRAPTGSEIVAQLARGRNQQSPTRV